MERNPAPAPRKALMVAFYVIDRRYSVPTLQMAQVSDAGIVADLARVLLYHSPHHLVVEARFDGSTLCRVVRDGPT